MSLAGVALPPRCQQADYLDVFEVIVAESDTRTPELLARDALEQSAPPIREGIRFAHKAFLLFRLGPADSPQSNCQYLWIGVFQATSVSVC